MVLDGADPFIATAKDDTLLDRWLFALGDRAVRDVMVAGRWQITERQHRLDARSTTNSVECSRASAERPNAYVTGTPVPQPRGIHMRLLATSLALGTATFLLAAAPAQASYCSDGKTVMFAGIDWQSGDFITEVMKTIFAKGYDCRSMPFPAIR